jgi:hypothetical protein
MMQLGEIIYGEFVLVYMACWLVIIAAFVSG